jgi:hypothetical protein
MQPVRPLSSMRKIMDHQTSYETTDCDFTSFLCMIGAYPAAPRALFRRRRRAHAKRKAGGPMMGSEPSRGGRYARRRARARWQRASRSARRLSRTRGDLRRSPWPRFQFP